MLLIIPDNALGVEPGYYTRDRLAALLREHATQPEVVLFLADMLEDGTEQEVRSEENCTPKQHRSICADCKP